MGGVTVADIDADTVQEVCASAYNGKVYCWDAAGALEPGFPVETDKGITRDQYTGADELNAHGDAVLAPPALADLDDDGTFELCAGAFDQKMYCWNHDGTRYAPWQDIFDASQTSGVSCANPRAIISVPVVADIDDDGAIELVFGTNETYDSLPNASGRMYAYEADGSLEPGWPVEVGPSPSPSAVPLVADGAGTLEIAIGVLGSPPLIFNHDGTQFALMNSVAGTAGGAGDDARCGTSTTYEVRSLPGIVAPNWAAGAFEAQFAGSADGAPQAVSLGAFGTPTTLMVRAFDEVGNGSPVAVNFPEPSRTTGLAAAVGLLAWFGRRRGSRT